MCVQPAAEAENRTSSLEQGEGLGAHRGAVRLEGLSEGSLSAGSSSHADRRNANLSFFSEKALFFSLLQSRLMIPNSLLVKVASSEKVLVLFWQSEAPHPRQSNVRFLRQLKKNPKSQVM